jgi:hypothetical protein
VVGEEILDKELLDEVSNQQDVWVMGQNFVVYKDRVCFPQDIVKKICHFETPCIPVDWCTVEDDRFECHSIIFCNPAVPCDLYLKEQYFRGIDEGGLGTILIGVKL